MPHYTVHLLHKIFIACSCTCILRTRDEQHIIHILYNTTLHFYSLHFTAPHFYWPNTSHQYTAYLHIWFNHTLQHHTLPHNITAVYTSTLHIFYSTKLHAYFLYTPTLHILYSIALCLSFTHTLQHCITRLCSAYVYFLHVYFPHTLQHIGHTHLQIYATRSCERVYVYGHFNQWRVLIASLCNELWPHSTWCKHGNKSYIPALTCCLMHMNHSTASWEMTAITLMNGLINTEH